MNCLIIINGPSGVGKSSVCELLWKRNKNIVYINLDELKWLINDYRKVEGSLKLTEKVAYGMMKEYLSAGLSVVMDKSFLKRKQVAPFVRYARNQEVPCFVYNLEAELSELKKRVKKRGVVNVMHKRKVSDTKHTQIFEQYHEHKFKVDKTFDTSKNSMLKIVKVIESETKLKR